MNNYSDKIDHLLSNFAFEDLSEEAKTYVLSEMTAIEYASHRNILVATQKLGVNKAPSLPSHLQAKIKKQVGLGQTNNLANRRSLMLYSILGVFLGGLLTTSWFYFTHRKNVHPPSKIQESMIIDTVYVQKHDTLFLPSEPEVKIITKEVIKYIEKEVPVMVSNPSKNNANEITDLSTQKIGTPIAEETELMDLLQEIPSDSFIEKE